MGLVAVVGFAQVATRLAGSPIYGWAWAGLLAAVVVLTAGGLAAGASVLGFAGMTAIAWLASACGMTPLGGSGSV